MSSGWLANIVSFGAAGRVDDALVELRLAQDWYSAKWDLVESRRAEVTLVLEDLVVAKQRAHGALRRVRELTDSLTARERSFITEQPAVGGVRADLPRVLATLESGDMALAAATSGTAAISSALGAWALVGAYGAASTGTALHTLGGAAAFNATLAWFGGGSIAAGGAGMAGGAAVLGGIVAVPALALMAMFSHVSANKKIAEMKTHVGRVLAEAEKCDQSLVVLAAVESRANELTVSISKARDAFEHEFSLTQQALQRPWHVRLWMWLKSILGASKYTSDEVAIIGQLGSVATSLARIIDQPLLDENGAPT